MAKPMKWQLLLSGFEADPVPSWKEMAPFPIACDFSAVAIDENRFLVAGGIDISGSPAPVQIFDIRTNGWTRMPDLSVGRCGCGAACYDNKVYVFGGFSVRDRGSIGTMEIEVLDLEAPHPRWQTLDQTVPKGRYRAVIAVKKLIYLFASFNGEFVIFDTESGEILSGPRRWRFRDAFALVGSHIYAVGDWSGGEDHVDTMETLEIDMETGMPVTGQGWTLCPTKMPSAYKYISAAGMGHCLLVAGHDPNTIDVLDTNRRVWWTLPESMVETEYPKAIIALGDSRLMILRINWNDSSPMKLLVLEPMCQSMSLEHLCNLRLMNYLSVANNIDEMKAIILGWAKLHDFCHWKEYFLGAAEQHIDQFLFDPNFVADLCDECQESWEMLVVEVLQPITLEKSGKESVSVDDTEKVKMNFYAAARGGKFFELLTCVKECAKPIFVQLIKDPESVKSICLEIPEAWKLLIAHLFPLVKTLHAWKKETVLSAFRDNKYFELHLFIEKALLEPGQFFKDRKFMIDLGCNFPEAWDYLVEHCVGPKTT